MTTLSVYCGAGGERVDFTRDPRAVASALAKIGVRFERWETPARLAPDSTEPAILEAYREPVQRLMQEYGFTSVDVVALAPDHPEREALRAKFLDEHTHGDFEVRFFVHGRGLFYLHTQGSVFAVLCEQGDLISVPAGTPHWFDMGPEPDFKCIRLFTDPQGWVAQYTGSDIAEAFPRLE